MDSLKVLVVPSPFANMSPLYEIDPDADVLLIVPPSTKPFAPWDSSSASTTAPSQQQTSSTALTPSSSSSGLRIKASSRHLSLASPIFRNKLHHANTKLTTQSDGRIHLSLAEGFDAKAVTIVLNAIHNRGRKVPREVGLEMLAKIALVVDRLGLVDAVEVWGDRWFGNGELEGGWEGKGERELVLGLYASWVFRRGEVFRGVSKVLVGRSKGVVGGCGLPVRERVIRDIEAQRQALVGKSLAILHNTVDDLASGKVTCSRFHCDSFLLGELVKTLYKNKLAPWPRPEKPYLGVSHAAIVEALNSSAQFQWRDDGPATDLWGVPVRNTEKVSGRKRKSPNGQPITPESSPEPVVRSGSCFDSHQCDARKLVGQLDELDALEREVVGLELENRSGFQRR